MFEPEREPDYVENLIATNKNFSLLGSSFSEVIERPRCGYEHEGQVMSWMKCGHGWREEMW